MTDEPFAESFIWNGLEEAGWMRPVREFVDGLHNLPDQDRLALHVLVDFVYTHAREDSAEEAGALADMRTVLERNVLDRRVALDG